MLASLNATRPCISCICRTLLLTKWCVYAFDSDTVFKPSVGSHYSSAFFSSNHPFEQTTWITAKHIPTPLIHSSLPSLCIGFPFTLSLLPSSPLSLPLLLFFFQGDGLEKKSSLKSIRCAKSACASFSALPREGGRGWREEGGIFTNAHLIVKHFLSAGWNTLRNVEK